MSVNRTAAPSGVERVRRSAHRACYDRTVINRVIDSSHIAHVGFVDTAKPVVIPMAHWRQENYLYLHSAAGGRLAQICSSADICVSIAALHGFVLARSAFNHSMNYESVVIHGRAAIVQKVSEREAALKAFMDRLFPGRWEELRPVKQSELNGTAILQISLDVACAKVRLGPPGDEMDDPDWCVWTGTLPLTSQFGPPEADPSMVGGLATPMYLSNLAFDTAVASQPQATTSAASSAG